ncbi:MAG: GntR family transcriptional regulator [Spirochaetae bacterium HGW-Spirochaetae-1]|nr:MAG: GntR family transcriptional regulator [Spirochaetae bacterium HGW-Spirochaetae-1]
MMVQPGKHNKLKVLKVHESGVLLDGEDYGQVKLHPREAPAGCKAGDIIIVFLYQDAGGTLKATTREPHAEVGQFALLKVVSVNETGAFLDWGLPKDLLVPFREQHKKMEEGKTYVVHIYFDETSGRIVASSKLNRFVDKSPIAAKEGEEVDLLICGRTDLGYKAVINGRHMGVLYKNEVFRSLHTGEPVKGFIKKIRDDGKIDLTLHKPGFKKVNTLSKVILERLRNEGGFIAVNDKSPQELIYRLFGESKTTFKTAIGNLYKKRKISIDKDGIRLAEDKGNADRGER